MDVSVLQNFFTVKDYSVSGMNAEMQEKFLFPACMV